MAWTEFSAGRSIQGWILVVVFFGFLAFGLLGLRSRRAISGVAFGAVIAWFFAAPIVQAKPQDRLATGIIVGVALLIVAVLFLPTAFLKWHARKHQR